MTSFENQNNIEKEKQNNLLNDFKNKFWDFDWYDKFEENLKKLTPQKKEEFLKVFKKNINNSNVETYFDPEREWLPNTEEKINKFILIYWNEIITKSDVEKDISIKEKDVTKTEKGKENELKQQKIETRNNIVNDLKIHPLYKEFFADNKINEILNSPDYKEWNKKNNDKDIYLYIIEKNYDKFLDIAIKKDIENKISPTDKNSNSYKLFSNLQALEDSWLNIQAELTFKLKLAEYSPDYSSWPTKTNLARLSIDTSEYHRTEIHWDILVYWDQVVNLATNEKFIKSKLWYLLKSSDLEFKEGKEYQERIDKTNDEVKWIDKEIKSNNDKIWAVNNLAKLDLLSDELFKKVDNDIRKKIEKFSDEPNNDQLKQEIVNDIKEYIKKLVSIFEKQNRELSERKDKLSESLIKLKEDYEKTEKQFKSKLEKKDKMQRESIKFINRIALDVIPQNLLNRLIDMLKSNMIIIPGLDIDRQAINLENQQFWNSVTVENETLWERNLIKFLNKLVYWEINPKDTIFKEDEIIKNPKFNIRPSTMRFTLESKDLMGSDWFHINKMIQNLRKVEKSK